VVTEKPEISLKHKNAMKKSKKNQKAFTVIHNTKWRNFRSAVCNLYEPGRPKPRKWSL